MAKRPHSCCPRAGPAGCPCTPQRCPRAAAAGTSRTVRQPARHRTHAKGKRRLADNAAAQHPGRS
eukprot:6209011-Pleurochrysis_carterae.AAC.4